MVDILILKLHFCQRILAKFGSIWSGLDLVKRTRYILIAAYLPNGGLNRIAREVKVIRNGASWFAELEAVDDRIRSG